MPNIYSLATQPLHLLGPIDAIPYAFTRPIRQYVTKIEWLDWQENVIGDYTAHAIGGSISIDSANDVRRTFALTMNNANGLYVPYGARTNMGVKVRIKRGIVSPNGTYWWNRGVFALSDPEAVHNGAEKTVSLQGADKWALLNGDLAGTLTETTVIPKNTNVADAIRAVAEDAGEFKFAFDVCAVTTPYTVTKEPGTTRAELIKELALIPSWDIYYDVEGYLRFRPLIDPLQKQVVANLSVGGAYRKCLIHSSYSPEWSKIKNYWKVIGYSDSATGITYDGSCQNNNPDSPTNTSPPPTGIGMKPGVLTDTNLTTDSLCEQRAAYELRKNLSKIDRTSFSVLPLPFLNEGDCIQCEDSAAGIDDAKYEIQSITEPLGFGLMEIGVWKCVTIYELVASDDFQGGLGDWQQLSAGTVDIFGISGDNCLRKSASADPNGGYRLLAKTITDFELVLYTRRDATGTGANSYSVTNASGNGYGVTLDYAGTLGIDRRASWARTSLAASAVTPSLGQWYTLRLIKVSSNLTAEVYAGKVTTFVSPLAVVDSANTAYTSFDRVAVNGGYTYYTDTVKVRRLL